MTPALAWLRPRAPQALAAGLGGCIVGSLILVNAAWHISLAARVGVPVGLVWTLPLALDATGILGGLIARIGASPRARLWGAAVGTFAVALSVAAACVEVLAQRGALAVTHTLAVGVVAVYGVMVGLAAHLLVLLPRAQRRASSRTNGQRVNSATRQSTGREPAPTSPPTRRVNSGAHSDRDAWVRRQLAAGVEVTGGDVDRHFGGTRNGHRVVKRVKAAANGHPS